MNLKLRKEKDYDPLMVTDQFGPISGSKDESGGSGDGGVEINHLRRSSYRRASSSQEETSTESLVTAFQSVALEWKSLRGVKECQCSAPLDFTSRKVYGENEKRINPSKISLYFHFKCKLERCVSSAKPCRATVGDVEKFTVLDVWTSGLPYLGILAKSSLQSADIVIDSFIGPNPPSKSLPSHNKWNHLVLS